MNELEIFNNQEFGSVRAFLKDGEPWFVAKDVCEILDIKNTTDAVNRLDNEEKATSVIPTQFGDKETNVINESGLYSLVFSSRKTEAKKFKRWVTNEVLPSIRKTGSYSVHQEPLSHAQFLLESAKMMVQFEKDIQALQEQNRVLESRVNTFDRLEVENDRQKLNAMIRKYATLKGCSYQQGWRDFRRFYNQSFNTNLTTLMKNYAGTRKISAPEYLEKVGKLDDALRVADKMIQRIA